MRWMPVLMSASQAKKLATQLRKATPGLVRVGVRSGAMYVEVRPDGEPWQELWRDEESLVEDEVTPEDSTANAQPQFSQMIEGPFPVPD